MEDDNRSVTSNGSTSGSTSKTFCPCCKVAYQTKAIFNHIRKKHVEYFQMQTTKEWLKAAERGKPLKINWLVSNDEQIILYGCLSSGKTFQEEYKGLAHFTNSPKDLKEHNKQISELIELRKEQLKSEALKKIITPLEQNEWKIARETNDPELIQVMRDIVMNHYQICERLCDDAVVLDQALTTQSPDVPREYQKMTVAETRKLLVKIKGIIDTKPEKYRTWSNILLHLERVLVLRKFFNGYTYRELDYPWFKSPDHPNGRLTKGDSRFVEYIFPWNEGYPVEIIF